MTDVKLTREQIEEWRRYISGDKSDATDESAQQFNAICDMALQSLEDAEDAARYRFFKKHLCELHAIEHFARFNNWHWKEASRIQKLGLDAAIDAARKESHD